MYRYSSVEPNERDEFGKPLDSTLVAVDFGFKNSLFNIDQLAIRKAPTSSITVTIKNMRLSDMTRYSIESADPLVIDSSKDGILSATFENISMSDIDNYALDSSLFKLGKAENCTITNSEFTNINNGPYEYDTET